MKKHSINDLMQEARVETSTKFTDHTMQLLEAHRAKRLKQKLWLLIVGITLFTSALSVLFVWKGFNLNVLGIAMHFPQIPTVTGFVGVSMLAILYIYHMVHSITSLSD